MHSRNFFWDQRIHRNLLSDNKLWRFRWDAFMHIYADYASLGRPPARPENRRQVAAAIRRRPSRELAKPVYAIHLLGNFESFLISRICWMWRSACVEISSIHCQQSITSRSPKLWARMSSLVVLMYSIMVARRV